MRCYAVLAELTLTAESDTEAAFFARSAEILGSDGTEVGTFQTAFCREKPLVDYPYAVSGLTVGITETVRLADVAVFLGDEELADRVQLFPGNAEFDLAATVTQTLTAG